MNTTPIYVSTEAYNQAVAYARKHNTSVEKMMETIILTTLSENQPKVLHRPTEYSPQLLKLIGIAKNALRDDDLNGDDARWEYLKDKYELK